MRERTVKLKVECATPLTNDQAESILEEVEVHAGTVSYGPRAISAWLFVEAEAPSKAICAGLRIFLKALRRAKIGPVSIMDAEAQLWDGFVREIDEPNIPELVGVSEVVRTLEVSKQRVSERARRPDFPAPVATLSIDPIRKKNATFRFLSRWPRKPGRLRKKEATS
ncbi:MAG: hypothetical protein QN189_03195 [Armatimonadota bacterium]|nr:hypothetical protein [Armatimonadota bacterium]